jgi:hypothetical protein
MTKPIKTSLRAALKSAMQRPLVFPWRLLESGYFVVGKLIVARRNGAAALIHRLGMAI